MCDEMTEKEKSYEPIRLLQNDLEHKRRVWLEKHGWSESCDFPDSCWRWCKEIDGKLMMCSQATAIKIELYFVIE